MSRLGDLIRTERLRSKMTPKQVARKCGVSESYLLAVEKAVPATIISVSTALVFPVVLILVLWPLGLTGIWLNFAGTSLLAAILSLIILYRLRGELRRPDAAI